MEQKIRIEKGNVQETLLLPLWGRAYETQKANPRLIDKKAVEIVEKLDYDFSTMHETQALSQHGWVARSLHTDKIVKAFIKKHPKATIVNIGCGMDTTFSRIDNGKIMFYELDFPDVIELRKYFYEDTDRHISISSSLHDTKWLEDIKVVDGLLFLAGGVLYYSSEEEVKRFFIAIADYFEECEFYFDVLSPLGMKIAKKMVLKKGGMGSLSGDGWGIKPIKSLEKWDSRIKVISTKLMNRGIKKGLPFKTKMVLTIPDILGISSMVHIKIRKS